jgi:hypothetical protein
MMPIRLLSSDGPRSTHESNNTTTEKIMPTEGKENMY